MSIPFVCRQCGKQYAVKDELAGRRAKCACGHILMVPQKRPGPIEFGKNQAKATKSSENLLRAFEKYQKDLNQLLKCLESGGKSGAAVALMQALANQDIGMMCWSVPDAWQSEASDSVLRLKEVLKGIQGAAGVLRRDFAAAEEGLPTLSMLADHISLSVSRALSAKSQIGPSPKPTESRPNIIYRIFPSLAPRPDLNKLMQAADIDGLANALDHCNKSVRMQAIEALTKLSRISGAKVVDILTHALNDAHVEVREAAKEALQRIKEALQRIKIEQMEDARDIKGLISLLNDGSATASARATAAAVLGVLGDREAVPFLAKLLGSETEQLVRAALEGLTKIGGNEAQRAVQEHKERTRQEQLAILKTEVDSLIFQENVDGLIKILENEDLDHTLVDRVVDGLTKLGMKALVPLLIALGDEKRMAALIQARESYIPGTVEGMQQEYVERVAIGFAARDYRRKHVK